MRRSYFVSFFVLVGALIMLALGTTAQVGVVGKTEARLSVRTGPSTDFDRVTVLVRGTNVALDGRDSSGFWVRGVSQNNDVGWMAARYLTIGNDAVFGLPVIDANAPLSVNAPAGAAPAAEPQAAAPAASGGGEGIILTATVNVNIRRGPGTNYGRVGLLNGGTQFNADGRNSSGGWVRGINSGGTVGWVSAAYVTGNSGALPVVGVDTPFNLGAPGGGAATTTTAAAAPAAPAAAYNPSPITGFSYGGHVRGLDDHSVNMMRIAGMSWAKYQIRYTPGDNPGGIAHLINDAHNKGFRVLLGVVGHPDHINHGGYFEGYAAYVGGLAALGADAIEVWNEMNLDREWPAGQINPASYTPLLAQAFNSIKANNPNTLVISGALAPTGAEAAFPGRVMNDNNYLAGMVASGALNYMDCLGVHYNEGIVPPTQNSGDPRGDSYYTRFYNGMVNTYVNITGGRKPLCFTELGYLTPEGFPPLPGHFGWAQNVTLGQQAAWLDQVMSMARRSGRVRIVIIWNINFTDYGADPMGGYAIIRPGGDCPACYALGS